MTTVVKNMENEHYMSKVEKCRKSAVEMGTMQGVDRVRQGEEEGGGKSVVKVRRVNDRRAFSSTTTVPLSSTGTLS